MDSECSSSEARLFTATAPTTRANVGMANSKNSDHQDEMAQTPEEATALVTAAKGEHDLEAASEDPAVSAKDSDVLYIQDVGFSLSISAPGMEEFKVQVSSMELVQEIHQLLMDREDTCHRTCFSLQLHGVVLDNFAELKSIEGLGEGATLKVVEEPYTIREARIHMRHVRDLLKSVDLSDAFHGTDGASLSYLSAVCQGDILEKKRTPKQECVDCTPPEFVFPKSEDRPIMPLHLNAKNMSKIQCIKMLTTSGWNPPPGHRKLAGDLMYICVVTMEDKKFHITSSSRGFYVNQTTDSEFQPQPINNYVCFHALVDLLAHISPSFKKNFSLLQRRRTLRHPFERVATPYQVFSWLSPRLEHSIDAIRAEDAFSSKLGYEEHIPGQTREWNEELQTTRELPRKTLPERLLRERAIFKVHSDFVSAATRGATAVIDGNVMAINPGEEAKMQMFIWNNIFFSLGFDVREHYKDLGGDYAAHVAPRNDLQGVKVYNAIDMEGLYTLGTVVIDYRGFRITAQSIIPGILEREQEQSVVYGSIDFGKTVVSHPKYVDLLQKAGSQLKIMPHSVVNEKSEDILLCSSVECKGIIGNDGRHYILDLLRTFPPDVNFLELENLSLSKEAEALGLPIVHKHKLACLRQELIDAFVESRYMMFIKYAAVQLQKLGLKKQIDFLSQKNDGQSAIEDSKSPKEEDEKEDSNKTTKIEDTEAKKIVESITDSITSGEKRKIEDSTKEIVKKAAKAVGSLKDSEFDLRFNPDVFSSSVTHSPSETESYQKQCALVKDAADFLLTTQIPAFIRDCLDHSSVPMDGATLSDNLHNRGINIRYLGIIANMLAKVPQLDYMTSIVVGDILIRSGKHVFANFIQGVEPHCLSAAICHFMNCLLFSQVPENSANSSPEMQKNSNKRNKHHKRKSRYQHGNGNESLEWTTLSSKSLWKMIKEEAQAYYKFDLNLDNVDQICKVHGLQKLSLLRAFCHKTGIQLHLREYFQDSKSLFSEQDILNVFPRVKHVNPRASDAYNFYTTGQAKIQQGYLKDGYELINEALNLLNNVYGAMHPEIAQCLRMLARLNYIMGDHVEALAYQQKAVLMSERVNGVDHPYTITEYVHLALYCFANTQVSTALKLLYRARYLCLLVVGENHPEVALIDSNIGLILHAIGEFDISLKFLEHALQMNRHLFGMQSLKVAVNFHLVARTQSCMGDFRSALQNEKEAYLIYKSQLGDEHEKTKESSECLRHLTQQAVVLQKKMNEIYTGRTKSTLPPIQIQQPSMGNVLDMLNIINGILFVQVNTPSASSEAKA
eukprot:maker-scaffold1121_size61474-snap-gene-0.19 protein:Tk07062 transcript:maker-scaffold1121_size61474-snap-gene-0.19-mRNA-1 annotation:"eukaryotic translation initiation factor 3"